MEGSYGKEPETSRMGSYEKSARKLHSGLEGKFLQGLRYRTRLALAETL
jgi:hypothetical protein